MRVPGALFIIAAISASAGCGPKAAPVSPESSENPPANVDGTGGTIATTRIEPTPESMCKRQFEFEAAGCGRVGLTEAECIENHHKSFEERGPEARQAITLVGRCLLDNETCNAAMTCIENLSQTADGVRRCEDNPNAEEHLGKPAGFSAADFANRKGANVTRYSRHDSSKESPIETCGVRGQLQWLLEAVCDDGSHPFRNLEHAHAARVRSVGSGGRCDAIIDLYNVSCPEGTYDIYIDAYVCPDPETAP
jgi:hypothetical protein